MVELIAYIPVLNQRHLDWFKRYPKGALYLISQEMAASLLPRLSRNMAAIPTDVMVDCLEGISHNFLENKNFLSEVGIVDTRMFQVIDGLFDPQSNTIAQFVLPDEDVSHAFMEKYLQGPAYKVEFEQIWARYDMAAVKRESPVMADVEVSSSYTDFIRMEAAQKIAPKSPDWWRQIGAVLFRDDELLSCSCNDHFPNEYTTYILGDPRLNVDAGQKGKYCSFHSEKSVIVLAAKEGFMTKGASIYTTVFPCEDCARAIALSGIKEVFFEEGYSALDAQEVLRSYGVRMIQVRKDPS